MSQGVLLATLTETLQEKTEQRRHQAERVSACREAVDRAQDALHAAQERAEQAVYVDEQITEKQQALTTYWRNTLPEKPQAILDKIVRLGVEQIQTYRLREQALDLVRMQQGAVREAQSAMGVAEKKQADIERDVQELLTAIERARERG